MRTDVSFHKSKKRYRTVAVGVFVVLIVFILAMQGYFWNTKEQSDSRMVTIFGYGTSVVLSGSMEPTLSVNDLVLVRATQDVSVGDIIVYQKEDQLIIHRVVSMDGTTLVTQGDANNVADEPIDISSVKGKMVSRIPVLGGLIRDLKTPIAAVAAKFITGDSGSDTAQCAAWVVQTQTDSEDTDLLINIYDKNNTDVHKAVYEFSIRNYNENNICEVSMTYQIDVVLPEAWEGITMKLTKNGSNKVLTGQTKDDQTFTFCSDDLSFVAGTAATDQLKLEISLAKGTKNEKAEKILDGILVNVTTVQSEE